MAYANECSIDLDGLIDVVVPRAKKEKPEQDDDDEEYPDALAELNSRCETVRKTTERRNEALNDEVYFIAHRVVLQQLDADAVRTRFTEAAQDTGLSYAEIRKTIKSALDAGVRHALNKLVIDGDIITPAGSEDALALLFGKQHCGELRYISAKKVWMSWKGTRWQEDQILHAFDLARLICRKAAINKGNGKNRASKALATAKTVAAVVSLVRTDKRLAATVDQWDTDDWLLNTPGGVVDLRTGELRKAVPDDYIDKANGRCAGCKLPHTGIQGVHGMGNGQ